MREFLEKNYTDEAIDTDDLTIKLVIRALLEVSGSRALRHGDLPGVPGRELSLRTGIPGSYAGWR